MQYLYYSIYKFILLTPSKNEQPEHIANIILALILSFTFFGIINLFEYFDSNLFVDFWNNKSLFIVMYISFLVIGYFTFIRNEKYIKLVNKFDSENKKSKAIHISLIILYLILLIVALFITD